MRKDDPKYAAYVSILREELVPAMGCTEPIAIAYAAAKARDILGCLPDKAVVRCSGSIIKNVKSVVVPNTGGMRGLEAAAAAGIVAGDAEKKLEVLSAIGPDRFPDIQAYLDRADIRVEFLATDRAFEMLISVSGEGHTADVRITDTHTNLTLLKKDGRVILDRSAPETDRKTDPQSASDASPDCAPASCAGPRPDQRLLNVQDIYDFAKTVDISDVRDVILRQVAYNMAIAEEGMRNPYGANIGKTLLRFHGGENASTEIRARALAAAGSDARMHGCSLPVVINSGSGNQGITVAVPLTVYAREKNASEEELIRALTLANLVAIQQKTRIGTLSAFCGAVCAGVGTGAGIAFLEGEDLKTVAHTIANALAILPGMVCDGAKPSCAAKISQAVEAGIFGYQMYKNGQQFYAGDGLVVKGVDANVETIGRLGREGMLETNRKIIEMMLGHADPAGQP